LVIELQKSLAFLLRFDAFACGRSLCKKLPDKAPKLPNKLLVYMLRIDIAATTDF